MGVALQCPECGFKHRLDAIGDRSVFSCAQCARELKVPAEYRVSAASAPNGANGAATRSKPAARTAAGPRPKHRVGATPMRLPVRILLWVVAFVLGAVVVRFLAKITGFAGGDTFFDLLIDGSIGTYLRLFALVPFWALFATMFATAFIDGPRAWARRRAGLGSAPSGSTAVPRRPKPSAAPTPNPRATAAAAAGAAAVATGAKRDSRSIPRREPAPVATPGPKASPAPARLPDPPPVAPVVAKTAAVPVAGALGDADDDALDFGARAASGQRPRRIPRRGAGS
jgi:hypothetical protein